jgi:hypothetical protein
VQVAVPFRLHRQRDGRVRGLPLQGRTLELQPPLELRCVPHEEAVQQGAPIEREGRRHPTLTQGRPERNGVTVEALRRQCHELATGDDDAGLQSNAKERQGTPQGGPRSGLRELRPEHAHEVIAPVRSAGLAEREIGEEGGPLGLGEDRVQPDAVGPVAIQRDGSEDAELRHAAPHERKERPLLFARGRSGDAAFAT